MFEIGTRVRVTLDDTPANSNRVLNGMTGMVRHIDNPANWDYSPKSYQGEKPPVRWILVLMDDPSGLNDDLSTTPGLSEKGCIWFRENELQLEVSSEAPRE